MQTVEYRRAAWKMKVVEEGADFELKAYEEMVQRV
jgi:hypothetical protein